jgi:type I restriction enzyme M protein
MIDASAGYMKDGPKNRLRAQDIHKIVDTFTRQVDVPRYARMASVAEIEKNDFNLNLPRYIDSQMPEDIQDIEGHLQGGIPTADVDALDRYWTVCPALKASLFKRSRKGYFDLKVDKADIKTTIYQHPEFAEFIGQMNTHFAVWKKKSAATLKALKPGFHPKGLIATLAENLLDHYAEKPLIESYDIYQHLMDYWDTTMQDDAYLIAVDGWQAETYRVIETKKGKDGKPGKEVDKGWACDLVPKALVVAKYYAKEQTAIDQLAVELEAATTKLAELEEEHGGEEGAFSELDKVNRANVADRLKEIKGDKESKDEVAALTVWLEHNAKEADLKKRLKDVDASLDAKALAHYPKLTEAEVDRVSQQLTQRVKELAERYETPLPQATDHVAELETKVNRHLEKMGFAWK